MSLHLKYFGRTRFASDRWPLRLVATAVLLTVAQGCGSGLNPLSLAGNASSSVATAAPNGPQLGYAWKADDKTLRPLLGIFGSALVGASVIPAATYANGAGSVVSAVAVLVGSDGQVYRMALPGGTPGSTGTSVAQGSRIHLSPSGTTAVLFVPGTAMATVLTKLNGTTVAHTVTFAGAVADAAASDTGSVAALLGVAGKTSVAVLPANGGAAVSLAGLGSAGTAIFSGTGDDLLVADATTNTLTLVRSASTSPSPSQLPTAGLLKGPVAVGATLDGRWAVVANGSEASVVRIDVSGATGPQSIVCPTAPRIVERMTGNGVFRFSDLGSAPIWTADMASPSPTMRFVPAIQAPRS